MLHRRPRTPSDVRATPRKAKARNAAKAKKAANRATKRKARVRTTVSQPTATDRLPGDHDQHIRQPVLP